MTPLGGVEFDRDSEPAFAELAVEGRLRLRFYPGGSRGFNRNRDGGAGSDGAGLARRKVFYGVGHGADVFRRGATAAANHARAQLDGLTGELGIVVGSGLGVNHTVADALRKAGIGLHRQTFFLGLRHATQDGERVLRADAAIGSGHVHAHFLQPAGGFHGIIADQGLAFVVVGELGDDGQR